MSKEVLYMFVFQIGRLEISDINNSQITLIVIYENNKMIQVENDPKQL